jgi:chemosensory pili system protein ChpC
VAAVVASDTTEIACVMIPVRDTHLLLPNVSVAEIVPWRRLKALDRGRDATPWCLGFLGWRGESVPVIRFELLNGGGVEASPVGRCIVVMNRARSRKGRSFYAVVADGLPRLLRLSGEDLSSKPVRLGPAEVASVRVGTEPAIVPNLSYIEEQIATLPLG